MTAVAPPTLPLADEVVSVGSFTDPILVDPDPPLLAALVAAYRESMPAAVDPDLDALRDAAQSDEDPLSPPTDLPTLTVLVRESVVDALAERFHPASRLAALAGAGLWDPRTLAEAQPNAVLAGRSTGCVLVAAACERDGDDDGWCRIGDDPTLRGRYDPVVAGSEPVGIRTPSRHGLYGALRGRCGRAVADEAVRLLDAGRGSGGTDPLDRGEARVGTYAAGARRGALDRDLRRACEDAGIGSSATFTRIKRELLDVGLIETESVSQPVGRPRQRLVARGALADASSSTAALAAVRKSDL